MHQQEQRTRFEWLVPLVGIVCVAVLIVGLAMVGEPPNADDGAQTIVDHYADNKTAIQVGSAFQVVAGALLIFYFGYLRKVLRPREGEGGVLSLLALVGATIFAVGASIDATIQYAISDAAEDIEPASVQALQALWDGDFLPLVLGSQVMWFAVGLAISLHGALPRWLGWVALALGVLMLTPVGFFAFPVGALWIVVVSVLLAIRARAPRPTATPTPTAAAVTG
jgi:hypothetical protein